MCLRNLRILIVLICLPSLVGAQAVVSKTDTASKKTSSVTSPKPYEQVITNKAITDGGLFSVHKLEEKYFFEIPFLLLGRDLLFVNRISKAPAGSKSSHAIFSGDQIGEKIVRFERGPNHKLFLKEITVSDRAEDSSQNGMFQSVTRSNLLPIIASYDIKAFNRDSTAIVIEVTDLMAGDNNILFFTNKKLFGITGAIQADKSYIESVKSYPINIEIATVKTYVNDPVPQTFELNSSIVLLPQDSMRPRYADDRVGYFSSEYVDFDANPQGVEKRSVITRWRLEPKEEDVAKYLRGELVEPKRPIVYYIDPATPRKWVPYLMQGVKDWQVAFEQAGFKNAIYALEAPTNDSTWSLYDARHNAIVYKASDLANASGPVVRDPRTGEILETHVNWYHNVMEVLRNWYFVQVAPNDGRARLMKYDDKLMGQLIRFVSAHEVGHTLGLMHNFGASSTVSVEKMRDKKWVEENGYCPSIMDYARFNYVAQPQDSISEKGLMPRIGMYDKWAIEWGYRWFPESKFLTKEEENAFMNQWVMSTLKKDKRYWYGEQYFMSVKDHRKQSEDLGDNAMMAGYYGIQNLKRIVPHLLEWTREPHKDYSELKVKNQQVINQYNRYIQHVVNNIGLYTWTYRKAEEAGDVVGFIPKAKQKQAVQFLHKQLFETPEWLINKEVFAKVGGFGPLLPATLQLPVINHLLSNKIYTNLLFFKGQDPKNAYDFDELLTDLERGIWKELTVAKPIDYYRRRLQIIYTERLLELLDPENIVNPAEKIFESYSIKRSDLPLIVGAHAKKLIGAINMALPKYSDKMSREHLLRIRNRLRDELNKSTAGRSEKPSSTTAPKDGINALFPMIELGNPEKVNSGHYGNCWAEDSFKR